MIHLNRICSSVQRLSNRGEFVLILFICTWWELIRYAQYFSAYLRHGAEHDVRFTDARLSTLVVLELFSSAAALWVGSMRGWSLSTFRMKPTWKGTGGGILLYMALLFALIVIQIAQHFLFPEWKPFIPSYGKLTLPFVILICIVNPIFEEVLEVGYFVHKLERFGKWPSVLASALFRTLIHTYQGSAAITGILPLGIIFPLVYWRYRSLWPLVVAHTLFDFFGLAQLLHS